MVHTQQLLKKNHVALIMKLLFLGCVFPTSIFGQESAQESPTAQKETTQQPRSKPAIKLTPVVITATRTEEQLAEVTRSVTVVTNEEIQDQAGLSRNLSDVLAKTVPGLGPTTEGLSTFGQTLRGRDFLVLIDGIPQSTALRSSNRDLNTIDVDAIERIEVVRGGTAAYGFGAAGGLIHIITKAPSKERLAGFSKAGMRWSTQHVDDSISWETTHRVSGTLDNIDYLLSGTYGQRGGFFDSSGDRIQPDPLGVQGGYADTDTYNILGKLGYEFDDHRQRVQLSVDHFNIHQDTNFTFGPGGDPANGIKTPAVRGKFNTFDPRTKNTIVGIDYINRDLLGSHIEMKGYYGHLETRLGKFPGFAQTEITTEKFGSRLTIDTPVSVKTYGFNAIWGMDYLHDEAVQKGLDGPTVVPYMNQDAIAGFLELKLPLGTIGLLRGGLRYEHISVDIDDVVNRRGTFVRNGTLSYGKPLFNASGILYVHEDVEAFASFSQSFSVADIGRAIRDANAAITSASQLQSEAQKVDSYEIGLRGQTETIQASVAGFYNQSNNGTTFNADLSIVKRPERIWGIEGALSYQIHPQVKTGGTVSWVDGEVDLDDDGDYDEDLPSTRISPVKLSGFLEYSPKPWWENRLQVLYIGNRTSNSTQFGGAKVNDYFIVDFISRLAVGPGHLSINVKNLLNKNYFPLGNQASATPFAFAKAPGRIIGLSYAFPW